MAQADAGGVPNNNASEQAAGVDNAQNAAEQAFESASAAQAESAPVPTPPGGEPGTTDVAAAATPSAEVMTSQPEPVLETEEVVELDEGEIAQREAEAAIAAQTRATETVKVTKLAAPGGKDSSNKGGAAADKGNKGGKGSGGGGGGGGAGGGGSHSPILVCHNGRVMEVPDLSSLDAHLDHDDYQLSSDYTGKKCGKTPPGTGGGDEPTCDPATETCPPTTCDPATETCPPTTCDPATETCPPAPPVGGGGGPGGDNPGGGDVENPLPGEGDDVEGPAGPGKPKPGKPGTGDKGEDEVLGEDTDKPRDKGGKPGSDGGDPEGDPGFPDEILGVDDTPVAKRAATVLPQTGAAENMAIQAGAGLTLLLTGALLLVGRRRQTDC